MGDRETTPPRLVPLIPVCLLGLLTGEAVYATVACVWETIAMLVNRDDDGEWLLPFAGIFVSGSCAVVASIGLRVVVRWWVAAAPPRPGTRRRPGASEQI